TCRAPPLPSSMKQSQSPSRTTTATQPSERCAITSGPYVSAWCSFSNKRPGWSAPYKMTRRRFAVIATAAGRLLSTPVETPQVGCQLNAFPLREGNFQDVLSSLEKIRELGYSGFECNIRYVRGQFNRSEAARKEIERTGVRFIGAHTSMSDAVADS